MNQSMGIRHPRQRGPGDCKWCRPRHGRPGLIKRAKWIPPSPRSYSEWWQIQVGGKREAEGSAVWVPSLISCPRGFSPLQFSCQGPHLSLFANRVFLTCHLLPLCPSADKGPGEITESISAASVRQRLLNTSGGAPSHPDTRGVRRPGSGAGPKEAPAGPPEEFAVPPPISGVFTDAPCPCLGRTQMNSLLRVRIRCSPLPLFLFSQNPTRTWEESISWAMSAGPPGKTQVTGGKPVGGRRGRKTHRVLS